MLGKSAATYLVSMIDGLTQTLRLFQNTSLDWNEDEIAERRRVMLPNGAWDMLAYVNAA